MKLLASLLAIVLLASPALGSEKVAPPRALPGAHAHNDYYHQRPLWDALERGFVSIEADVFLVDGQLLVGHYQHELRPQRSLESLYLEPLRRHVEASDGRVFAGPEQLTLLVDFKTDGAPAYGALDALLQKYEVLVSVSEQQGDRKPAPLEVIVTGDRPVDLISDDKDRRASLDGRLPELDRELSVEVMPLVSENWASHFTWRGRAPMPAAERTRLKELTEKVHAQRRQLRFWGTPDLPAVWTELQAAGVDVIGADDLGALQKFLRREATTTTSPQ